MQPFSLLIKPASADCNLRCDYCFYLDRASLYPETTTHRMQPEVLQRLVRGFLALPMPVHTLAFQGGEPLMMGEEFYREVVRVQECYARPGAVISNSVQTNGTLITPTLAEFFARRHFLTGVSVDGPAEIHDRQRCNCAGKGSHADVIRGIDCLRDAGAEFNILTLVSQANIGEPEALYDYLRDDLGVRFHQYIECVEFAPDGSPAPFAVTPEQWGEFLCRLFDHWYATDTRRVSVRLFDSLLARLISGEEHACTLGTDCRKYLVVEHNGDVYPCDFYVRPEYKLGNILTHDWDELVDSPLFAAFGARKRTWNVACAACPHLDLCRGDCPKNRVGHSSAADPATLSYLCPGWKRFYAYARPRLEKLAENVRKAQRKQQKR